MDGDPTSSIIFNNLDVGATTSINLAPADGSQNIDSADKISKDNHKFISVGLKTGSLIFNFDAGTNEMSLSGLVFDQVYAAKDYCKYIPPSDPTFSGESVGKPPSHPRAPHVYEVMQWLNSNCLETTQPFSAFVDAAQKSGNDDDARQLRIKRATKELLLRFGRIFGWSKTVCERSDPGTPHLSLGDLVNDVVASFFGTLLW
jgi:hypothetical protein